MLGGGVVMDGVITEEEWRSGEKEHAEITFSAEENALSAGEYWISFWGVTGGGGVMTLGSGVCNILESGGISLTPPEPMSAYYTAEECDEKLANYYTSEECDEKFAPIGDGEGSVDLSEYYTKAETYAKSETYAKTETYTKTEVDSALQDYCTTEECDEKLANYYTAEECDEKFAPIGDGSGSNGNSTDVLMPVNKGELVVGTGSTSALLAAGNTQQLLVADPSATEGMAWKNYPWQLLCETAIGDPTSAVSFENVFDEERFHWYKLSFDFLSTSVSGERLLMIFGYDGEEGTSWETSASEYTYSTNDFFGSVAKYSAYQFVNGFFGFGNESATYRYNGDWVHGEIDIWNDGGSAHGVQALARTVSCRGAGEAALSHSGFYNFFYRNIGEQVIHSLKIYVASGTLNSGRFRFYGMH
jgi:hypothetical protein